MLVVLQFEIYFFAWLVSVFINLSKQIISFGTIALFVVHVTSFPYMSAAIMNSLATVQYERVWNTDDDDSHEGIHESEADFSDQQGNVANQRQKLLLILTAVSAFLVLFCIVITRIPDNSQQITCPRTSFFPFKIGCPTASGCSQFRRVTQPMNTFGAYWTFGELGGLHDAHVRAELSDSAIRKRFPLANTQFVRRFFAAEDALERGMNLPRRLQLNHQDMIHLSLSYVCCVTPEEIAIAKRVVRDFAQRNSNLSIPIHLNSLACYHERVNSVTNILVADDTAQQRILKINHELANALNTAGVPVYIERMRQMPFHFTLLGVHTRHNESIENGLHSIASAVNAVKQNIDINFILRGELQFWQAQPDDDLFTS